MSQTADSGLAAEVRAVISGYDPARASVFNVTHRYPSELKAFVDCVWGNHLMDSAVALTGVPTVVALDREWLSRTVTDTEALRVYTACAPGADQTQVCRMHGASVHLIPMLDAPFTIMVLRDGYWTGWRMTGVGDTQAELLYVKR